MVQAKANLGDGLHQVRLESRHLVGTRKNPGSAPQIHRVGRSIYRKRVRKIGAVRALFKPHLPRRLAMPLPQTFALHLEIIDVSRVKNQHEARRSYGGDVVREWIEGKTSIAELVHMQRAGRIFGVGYQITKLGSHDRTQCPR